MDGKGKKNENLINHYDLGGSIQCSLFCEGQGRIKGLQNRASGERNRAFLVCGVYRNCGGSRMIELTEFMRKRYADREDKDNMFGVGVSDSEFRQFIIDYLLGEDWYVVDPLGQTQINEIALYEILEKYSKRYRKECKGRK